MIDTIRWKVPITDKIYDDVKHNSFEVVVTDVFYGFEEKRTLKSQIKIKGNELTVFAYDRDNLIVEGSVPKLVYGHNAKLFYPSQLPVFLQELEQKLIQFYGSFTSYEFWQVQRLDMCYEYKFETHVEALHMLRLLSTLRFPRKSIHIYPDESITWGGRSYSVKFYLKEQEFRAKDYRDLLKEGLVDIASEGWAYSKNILRFEVTNRKYNLNQILKKTERKVFTYKDILDINLYYDYLNKTLHTLFKGANRETMKDIEVYERLKKHKSDKAKKYFMFYKLYYLQEPFVSEFMRQNHDQTTVRRIIKEMSELGIGIPDQNKVFDFQLSVPSPLVPNAEPSPAVAGEV